MFPAAPFLSTLLHRVKAVVRRVVRPVAARARPMATEKAASAPISPVMRGIVQDWMSAKLRALSALMRRIEAGEEFGPAVRSPRAATREDGAEPRAPVPPEERLPRGFGWMCSFGPDVRADGALFAAWLNEPVMKAKVLAAPEQMVRAIAPILTATGAAQPEWFPAVAKRRKGSALPKRGRSRCEPEPLGSENLVDASLLSSDDGTLEPGDLGDPPAARPTFRFDSRHLTGEVRRLAGPASLYPADIWLKTGEIAKMRICDTWIRVSISLRLRNITLMSIIADLAKPAVDGRVPRGGGHALIKSGHGVWQPASSDRALGKLVAAARLGQPAAAFTRRSA